MAYCKANQLDMHGFCNRFDAPCIKKNCRFFGVKTNADRIRAMSDEELASYWANNYDNFCQNKPECGALLDTDEGIPEEFCVACALAWLQQPAEDTPT